MATVVEDSAERSFGFVETLGLKLNVNLNQSSILTLEAMASMISRQGPVMSEKGSASDVYVTDGEKELFLQHQRATNVARPHLPTFDSYTSSPGSSTLVEVPFVNWFLSQVLALSTIWNLLFLIVLLGNLKNLPSVWHVSKSLVEGRHEFLWPTRT